MSTEKFIITKEDSNYAVIPNNICQQLADAEALGLYVYLVSLPPQWEFYKAVIRKHFGWGRDKLEKKLAVLRAHNLIEPVPDRNEKGQFVGWNLHVKNGRGFTPIQNTENPCSGDLSTGLSKNSTQNTENAAAGKPVTGFSTPIKDIDTKDKAYRKKSFCEKAQKKPKSGKTKAEWREENNKRPAWADKVDNAVQGKEQMDSEAKHIEEHEARKREEMAAPRGTRMPESLRTMISNMKAANGGGSHDRPTEGGRMQEALV